METEGDAEHGIPPEAITLQFVRAGGPGGQHVNKTSSAVQLRVDLDRAALPAPVRARLERLVPGQITRDGELVITAQSYRSQHRNREDALTRLAALVREARRTPRRRIPTKPSEAQKRQRREAKRLQSERKRERRAPKPER
jgi:ribosome-associated protein